MKLISGLSRKNSPPLFMQRSQKTAEVVAIKTFALIKVTIIRKIYVKLPFKTNRKGNVHWRWTIKHLQIYFLFFYGKNLTLGWSFNILILWDETGFHLESRTYGYIWTKTNLWITERQWSRRTAPRHYQAPLLFLLLLLVLFFSPTFRWNKRDRQLYFISKTGAVIEYTIQCYISNRIRLSKDWKKEWLLIKEI